MTVGAAEVPVKYIHNSIAMVTSIPANADLDSMKRQVTELCHFDHGACFTLKWIDEEQDPCVISSDMELKEAIRLLDMNKECQLTVMVFSGVPPGPGKLCPTEDISMYRRNAKRWKKKYYLFMGHKFAARRYNKNAICAYCHGRIWNLTQPGFKCINCRLLLHRKCKFFVRHQCGEPENLPPQSTKVSTGRMSQVTPDQPPMMDHTDRRSVTPVNLESSSESDLHSRRTSSNQSTVLIGQALSDSNQRSVIQNPMIVDKRKPRSWAPAEPEHYEDRVLPILEDRLAEMSLASPASAKQVGLDDFKLLKVIGRGSYAKVFQVEHIQSGRIYAMKVIKKELILDEEDFEWVQTEKHVYECATNHPFLVGLHSCFQTESRLFFVIEFVNGGDLMYYMQRNLRLIEDQARFYAAEICLALNFLHERGIIYRDLKLDNVLMDSEGHLKLTDYGMCKEGITADVLTSTFCGTPNYIAPEILKGHPYNFSVDWWALGVLMFEMLAGKSPWDNVGRSENPDQNTEEYLFQVILEVPIRFPRSVSAKAKNVLQSFLTREPSERLGCLPNSSFGHIMSHPFFQPIDWVALEQRQVIPPYRPHCGNDKDLRHFDPTFTGEPVAFTPDNKTNLAKIDQSEFEGFEYINPLLMSVQEPV